MCALLHQNISQILPIVVSISVKSAELPFWASVFVPARALQEADGLSGCKGYGWERWDLSNKLFPNFYECARCLLAESPRHVLANVNPDMFLRSSTCAAQDMYVCVCVCVCVCVGVCVCVCVMSAWTDWVLLSLSSLSLSLRRPPSHQKSSAQQPRVIRYQADRCQNCRAMPATLISIRLNR